MVRFFGLGCLVTGGMSVSIVRLDIALNGGDKLATSPGVIYISTNFLCTEKNFSPKLEAS